MQPKWISFEGIEGVGKSTLVAALVSHFNAQGISYLSTREPGGSVIAERLRQVLLMPCDEEKVLPETELLLMFAARAQHWTHTIAPALEKGQWVLCDRFVDASFAYQGGGRGLPTEQIERLSSWLVPRLPDKTFWLDLPVEQALARLTGPRDRIEQERAEFFEKVRGIYVKRANDFPERIIRLHARQTVEQ